jgi:hypothetical protein
MIMNELITKYAANGLILELDEDRVIGKCVRVSARAKLGYKIMFNYRFRSVERMVEYVEEYINDHINSIAARAARKETQKQKAVELAANVNVGDIFVSSWGYEQTNVDFYQVIEKPSASTVIVRKIAAATVDGSEGYMYRNVRAVPNAFIGAPMKKRLDAYGGFKISSFQIARPTTAEKEHYNSWYY